MKRGNTRILSLKSALLLGALVTAGWAAQAEQAVAQDNGDQIETVVVTANKRAENVQRVPIAIAAITGEEAAAKGVTDGQSLANSVPGLTFDRETGTALPFIRGVGSATGQVSAEPSVAYYVDDVYIPAAGASLGNFNDIDRIEVEKGPQGTLFGRNATGGVIQVYTKNPTDDPELDFSAGYANYDTVSGALYATDGLAPNLSANFAAYGSHQNDGWGRNLTTGQQSFKQNWDFGGRLKFLWTPTVRTTILLSLDHDSTVGSEGYYRPAPGTTGPGGFGAPKGFYDLVDFTNPHWGNFQSGVSLKATQDMDWAKLVSITAYRHDEQRQFFDQAGAPFPVVPVRLRGPDATWTQEFQLLSPDSPTFNWILGLFYYNDKSGYDPLALFGGAVSAHSIQTSTSYAGYGQATATIFPDTHLTAGLRYTIDKRGIAASLDGIPDFNSPLSKKYSQITGRFSLDHQFTDDIMGYISYNRGFKSGIFDAVAIGALTPPVSPETLDDYSIGEKAEFFDHHLRLNSEAFYYSWKNLQVSVIVPGGTAFVNAAAATVKGVDMDATWIPVEHLSLTAGMEILDGHYTNFPNGIYWVYDPATGGNCGWLPHNANGCPNVPPPRYNAATGNWNLAGDKTIDSPPFTFSFTADYNYPTSVGEFDFNVAYNHGGDYYFDPDNGRGQPSVIDDKQPVLNLVNASVMWTSLDGRYDARVWGKNITGEKYISYGLEEQLITQWSPAPPATYGITLGVHF